MTTEPNGARAPSRRSFLGYAAMLGAGSQALWHSGSLHAAVAAAKDAAPGAEAWPGMTYRTLGRTGFNASRLVFGCGAALSRKPNDALLESAFAAGVNTFDVGSRRYYGDAERNLSSFLARHRDEVFLISKGQTYLDVAPDDEITVDQARQAARTWATILDESLVELRTDHMDAYYQMGANNPHVVGAEEVYRAFQDAKAAGKVSWYGVSTHENAANVLQAAIDSGWYDLAMIAITPAGWYDWESRKILEGTPNMKSLRPLLDEARAAGIGLVGMKVGRLLAGRGWLGGGDGKAFDGHYDAKLLGAQLSDFQRSYAYVLEHGMDVVNADVQNYGILKENFVAAATAHEYAA